MTPTPPRRLVIPGGNGFLGRIAASWFAARGWEVAVLSRSAAVAGRAADVIGTGSAEHRRAAGSVRFVAWDGHSLGHWARELDGAAAVLNLAGRSVNCRYTRANRRAMMDSRIRSTRIVGRAIAACAAPPPVWLNSSTATIYRHSYDTPMDEATGVIAATPEAKDAFSIEIATAWERELDAADVPATRKVALRAAMVLGPGVGGVARVLARLTRLGLGGRMGHGRQFVSWIHEVDFCRAAEWLIDGTGGVALRGPVNLAAPNPLPNADMMRTLRQICRVPFGLPATRWMLEIGAFFLRTETELILKSRRVVPGRLLESGFCFEFPGFETAARDAMARM